MASPHPIPSISTALIPYDPTLPHISLKAHFEDVADKAIRHFLEIALFESQHLCLEGRLIYLVQNLPKMLPFPFSGVIAMQAGDGPMIQACHCPNQAEFTEDQVFNVLSVGKLFTATAVLQLIEEMKDGKFALDTPLSELLEKDELDLPLNPPYLAHKPDAKSLKHLKNHCSKITLAHLLSHTAGFVERPGPESDEIAPRESWDLEHIGTYCYSNYGYQLLARIIGKHTNSGILLTDHEEKFRLHIEERIFKPARMEGAIREIHSPSKHRLDCFEISEHGVAKRVESPHPYPHGNGCWRMTAADLLGFGSTIRKHHVLIKESSFKTMMEYPGWLGFWKDHDPRTGSVLGYGHPGGGAGMSSFFNVWKTDPPITAVVLSNYSGCEMVKPFLDPLMQQ